jgi:hypothetical protein
MVVRPNSYGYTGKLFNMVARPNSYGYASKLFILVTRPNSYRYTGKLFIMDARQNGSATNEQEDNDTTFILSNFWSMSASDKSKKNIFRIIQMGFVRNRTFR